MVYVYIIVAIFIALVYLYVQRRKTDQLLLQKEQELQQERARNRESAQRYNSSIQELSTPLTILLGELELILDDIHAIDNPLLNNRVHTAFTNAESTKRLLYKILYSQEPWNRAEAEEEDSGAEGNPLPLMDMEESPADLKRGSYTDKLVLIIINDDPMSQFLRETLSTYYCVETIQDEELGYEKALEIMPDIILGEINVLKMNGLEMCERVKKDPRINHIPLILLSSQGDSESRYRAMVAGANDYLHKPCSIKLLVSRIDNIFKDRELLISRLSNPSIDNSYPAEMNNLGERDREFLSTAFDTVISNIANSSYSVEQFATDMHMSRTKFYNKLKALVDMTPNNFIVATRLKHAIELLDGDPNLSIGDVSIMCGFNSQQYFCSCFRRKFNMTVTQYIKSR